jgi:hypothetical protein
MRASLAVETRPNEGGGIKTEEVLASWWKSSDYTCISSELRADYSVNYVLSL